MKRHSKVADDELVYAPVEELPAEPIEEPIEDLPAKPVAAETAEPEAIAELTADEAPGPLSDPVDDSPDGLTSDDRGGPGGHDLALAGEAAPDEPGVTPVLKRDPGSCINCGQVGFTIKTIAAGVYQCSQCGHIWTAQDERAPFRRGLNLIAQ